MDTEIGCFMKPEVATKRRTFSREFKIEAVKPVRERGVSVAQAGRDLDVHENVLRKWVKGFGSDPVQAFPGHGQMKPEQKCFCRSFILGTASRASWPNPPSATRCRPAALSSGVHRALVQVAAL